MNKNTIIKCSLFLSYLILIVAIICLWHQEPATPELNLFYNQENVLASLPDYPNRHINKQNWNKGVNVECGKNSSLSKNKFIIIEIRKRIKYNEFKHIAFIHWSRYNQWIGKSEHEVSYGRSDTGRG